MLLAAEQHLGDQSDGGWGVWPAHERRGRRGVRELLDKFGDDRDLRDDHPAWDREVLARPLSGGLWGAAHAFARVAGLVGPEAGQPARPSSVESWKVTARLPQKWRAESGIDGDRPYGMSTSDGLRAGLDTVPQLDDTGIDAVREQSISGGTHYDVHFDRPVAALHQQWSALEPTTRDLKPLNGLRDGEFLLERQRQALHQARLLAKLLERLERPYRKWMRGDDIDMLDGGELAARLGELDGRPSGLAEALESNSMATVHAWVCNSPDRERSTTWERGVDPGPYLEPEFGLGSPHALFVDGVRLRGGAG